MPGGSEVKDQSAQHNDFQANLSFMKPCVSKEKKTNIGGRGNMIKIYEL